MWRVWPQAGCAPDKPCAMPCCPPPASSDSFSQSGWGVTGVGKAEWVASPPSAHGLMERLIARCRKKPVAALLDEAHTLDLDVGELLLNAGQDVRPKAPFLLVLAGTPGLLAHLGKMSASFRDRLGKRPAGYRSLERRRRQGSAGRAARRAWHKHRRRCTRFGVRT